MNRVPSCLFSCVLASGCLASSVIAVEPPAEIKAVEVRRDAARADAEKAYHEAQAKADDEALKDLEKLMKIEKKKKTPLLTTELDQRIQALTKEAALLRDEPLMKANAIDERIKRKEFTVEDWDAVVAPVFVLQAREARNATKITVSAGQLYYVVPHPEDAWQAADTIPKVNWQGDKDGFMKLLIYCGEKQNDGLFVTETGPLALGPKDTKWADNVGTLRVKILRVH